MTVITGGASGPVTGTVYNYNNASGDLGAAVVPNSHFGYAVAVGRFQPGTYASLAVGEPDRVYFGISQAGRVGVGLGGATGLDWTGDEQHILLESEAGGTISEGDRFGMRLAAGRFEAVGSYDEVVVGVIMDDLGTGTSQLGQICGFYGGAAGPGNNGWFGFNQGTCNSSVGYNHSFGRSLAFGFFDDSGKGALAAGAPGDANGTGAVHIIAPWRQRYNLHCNTAVITDCEGEWIFSLRPFDRVCIASTTKTMTTLIAAERSQLPSGHPLRVPLSTQYQVKPWIRTYVGGSRYEFWPDEKMRFEDLLYACMYPSGNDASYAIADLLTGSDNDWEGEYPLTCTDFVAEMNARAAALGMDDTFFTNPAGLDAGGPYSTAADMALLARAAMENPLVREVVGQTEHTIDMSYWNYQTGQREDAERTVQNGFLMGLQYSLAEMNGIKGGGTPCAQTTGVFAANSPGEGIAVGGTFGTQFDLPGDPFWYEAPDLMTLGLAECNLDVSFVPGPPEWRMSFGGLNSLDGERIGGGGEIIPGGDRMPELEFTLVRSQGTGFTSGEIVFHRSSEVQFTGGELVNFGVAPFQAHGGFVFTNQGDGVARFRVNTSYPGDDPVVITLDPGESAAIPPYSGPTTGLNVSIENQTGDIFAAPMFIAVREMYAYDLPLIGGTTALDISVPRNGSIVSDGWSFDWVGTDPDGGSTFYASAHEGGSTVDVAPDEIEVPGVPVSMKPASPNPFQSRTRLAFELGEPGAVALEIYDAQGRRVRRFAQEAVPAGSWLVDWDGSGDGGVPVANGVYFYRLNFEGRPAGEGRVALLR
ncbi:MAG: T9SS type A sorting domain-containing protein [Candidatus Eisenbacteria bacterium]|nr:T9SS type A sorting domain-containing protein [Candidatus Eisenbacteria bacterium]